MGRTSRDERAPRNARPRRSSSGKTGQASAPRHAAPTARRAIGPRAARAVFLTVLATATLAVIVAVGALPARNWLELRRTSAIVERRLADLEAANAEAEAEAEALQSDAEVERIAREAYGYARAGEEVYHLLPEARDPVRVPDTWPFTGLGAAIDR